MFDLDDTLVFQSRKRKGSPIVPRQTYHLLRTLKRLGHTCFIVTYNGMAPYWVKVRHLSPFIHRVAYGDRDRHELVRLALGSDFKHDAFVYIDDREDNIEVISKHFPGQVAGTVHVTDVFAMHAQLKTLLGSWT